MSLLRKKAVKDEAAEVVSDEAAPQVDNTKLKKRKQKRSIASDTPDSDKSEESPKLRKRQAKRKKEKAVEPMEEESSQQDLAEEEETIYSRKSRRASKETKSASVAEVLTAVTPKNTSLFKKSSTMANKPIQSAQPTTIINNYYGSQGTPAGDQSAKSEKKGLFNVTLEKEESRSYAINPDIAAAFGVQSSLDLNTESKTDSSIEEVSKVNKHAEETAESQAEESVPTPILNPAAVKQNREAEERAVKESNTAENAENANNGGSAGSDAQSGGEVKPKVACSDGVIIKQLADVTEMSRQASFSDGDVEIYYRDDCTQPVIESNGMLLLANVGVYVDGYLQDWDDQFEIKLRPNAEIEVDTGVSFRLPKGYKLCVGGTKEAKDKYFLEPVKTELNNMEAAAPLTVSLQASEGAYLSRMGRLISCQIIKVA